MSYRPITDLWILARPKVRYYGAYPSGFLERARALLGVTPFDAVLHVCGGKARDYPAQPRGFGPNDQTLDLNGALTPTFCQSATMPLPRWNCGDRTCLTCEDGDYLYGEKGHAWPALIADPPYTIADAENYPGANRDCPQPNEILRHMLNAVRIGGRVGMLHYVLPQPPKIGVKFVACVGVIVGYNNRMRCFSVFERLGEAGRPADRGDGPA